MRPELLHPADGPADDHPHAPARGDRSGPGVAASLVLALGSAALLVAAPALLGPLAVAATAVGLLVGLPLAVGRAWHALDRLVARTRAGRAGRTLADREGVLSVRDP